MLAAIGLPQLSSFYSDLGQTVNGILREPKLFDKVWNYKVVEVRGRRYFVERSHMVRGVLVQCSQTKILAKDSPNGDILLIHRLRILRGREMGRRAARKGRSGRTQGASVVERRREEEREEVDEESESNGGGFFACYLLCSLSPRHKGRTYIG